MAGEAIFQIAYVVPDLDEAIEHWGRMMGVGPFFVIRHARYREQSFKGEPTSPDLSLAFAYAGSMNVELIQQHDDSPSIYAEFIRRHGYGLQHVGKMSDDIDRDTADLRERGATVLHRGVSVAGVETRFFNTELHPGATLELIAASPGLTESFAAMHKAAADWDGRQLIARES